MSDEVIVKDRAKYIEVEYSTHSGRRQVRKEKRFLCFGGPEEGAYRAHFELDRDGHFPKARHGAGYRRFNDAGGSRLTQVWLWTNE